MFFSEEKNQKTFVPSPAERSVATTICSKLRQMNKSLLVLFFRKEHAFHIESFLKVRSGMARITAMMPHQNHGT
jgi:hypothetical protein